MNCPGAYTLQEKLGDLIPEDNGSEAATLGTELHARAEAALKGECEPCEATQFYVSFCRQLAAQKDAEMIVEAKVPLFWSREEHGYADCVIRTEDTVHVIDYKSGSIPIDAVNNYQLLIYAYGMGMTSTEVFTMTIIQNDEAKSWSLSVDQIGTEDTVHVIDLKTGSIPIDAVNNYQLLTYAYGMGMTSTEVFTMTIIQDNEAKSWSLSVDQIEALSSVIGVKAQAALNPYIHELNASDEACMFCPCRPFCKAYTASLLENFDDLTGDMVRLSDEKQAYLFSHKSQITKALNAIEASLFSRVNAGEAINGVSITTGRRAAKAWSKDIDPVAEMVANGIEPTDAIVSKPISPTQALKLSPGVKGWIQPEGKPKLMAGEAYNPANDFDVLE